MKSKKLFKFGVLALSVAALGACGKHEHTPAAEWTNDKTQHWHACAGGEVDGEACAEKLDAAAHTFGAETVTQQPTCTVAGKKEQVCTVCGYKKTGTVPATGHTYEQVEGKDKVTWSQVADCTNGGVGTKKCTVCQTETEVTADPLRHVYEQEEGEDKVVWSQVADCEKGGIGKKKCTRCEAEEDVTTEKLGHDLEMVPAEPAGEGKATVALYECKRCDTKFFGFKASEVSNASKERLDIDAETGGAKFKGRPIGNAVPLPQQDGGDHTPVWDKNETGDFFEYVFDLNQAQIDAIGEECLLYCDAKPAQWMNENNLDFWACPAGQTEWNPQSEWTPGMYIDDAHPGTHVDGDNPNTEADETETGYEQGQYILDYRYILYVDGEPVEFNEDITNPVGSGNPRGEYVLPYIFKLHTGENKISLRMAGGYLSEFFNFTFRPYVAPEPEPFVEDKSVSLAKWSSLDYTSASEGIEKAGSPAVVGESQGFLFKNVYNVGTPGSASNGWTQTLPVEETETNEGDKVVYTLNADKAVTGAKMYMTICYNANSWDSATLPALSMVSNDGTKGCVWNGTAWEPSPVRYKLFVNDTEVVLNPAAEGYTEPVMGNQKKEVVVELPCSVDLKAGDNKIELQNYGGYNALICGFEVKGAEGCDANVRLVSHAHDITYGDPVAAEGKTTTKVGTCSICGRTFISMDATDLDGVLTKGNKLPKGPVSKVYDGSAIARFVFNVETEGDYDVMINAAWDSNGNGARCFYDGKNGNDNAFPMADGKTNTVMTINGEAITLAQGKYASLAGVAEDAAKDVFHDMIIARVHLVAGENVFTMAGTSSYGLKYNSISFVK